MTPTALNITLKRIAFIVVLSLSVSACLGKVVGTVVDVGIEVAKVPFKVGGAAVDVIAGDKNNKSKNKSSDDSDSQSEEQN